MKRSHLFVAGSILICAVLIGFLILFLNNSKTNGVLNQAALYTIFSSPQTTVVPDEVNYLIKFDPDGKYGFIQGCVVPAFAIKGQPICPVAFVINAIGNCCVLAAKATKGGVCTPCSACRGMGQGAGACRLVCQPTCGTR